MGTRKEASMDGEGFDCMTRSLAGRSSRRSSARLLAVDAVAAVLAGFGVQEGAAACRRVGQR